MRRILAILLIVLLCASLSGCFAGQDNFSAEKPAGFVAGIWHGWIAPLSLILGFFNREIRVYEPFNTGWYYDLAFYIAIVGGFGTVSLLRKRK